MRRVGVKILAGLGFALAAALAHASEQPQTIKRWSVGCNNVRVCTAVGFAPGEDGFSANAYLTRGAKASDGPKLIFSGYLMDGQPKRQAVQISIDGQVLSGFRSFEVAGTQDEPWEIVLTQAESSSLLARMRSGSVLRLGALGEISLEGLSGALRFMDDRQKRAGTVTALVAVGNAPASQVPAPPVLPTVKAAAAISQKGLPTRIPKGLLGHPAVKACEWPGVLSDMKPVSARLGPDQLLWEVPCDAGAYNLISLYMLGNAAGTRFVPAVIEGNTGWENQSVPSAQLVNASYDPGTRQLSAFNKGRGLGDCGSSEAWMWDGRRFARLDETVMGECEGVTSEHWINIFHAQAAK
jgi:hypothetical protein